MNDNSKQKTESDLLKEWFKKQTIIKTMSELAKQTGIPARTIYSYFHDGKIALPENREKLYKATGLDVFKPQKIETETTNKKKTLNLVKEAERPYLDATSELKEWFNKQDKWHTKKDFAMHLGISYSMLKKIFNGKTIVRDGAVKQKLYDATQLNRFKDIETKMEREQITEIVSNPRHTETTVVDSMNRIEKCIKELQEEIEVLKKDKTEIKQKIKTSKDDAENLADIFYSLASALESFKYGNEEKRKKIRKKIPAQDVGYVISFLKALYDEDNFKDFMFFSDYKLKGDKSE